MQGCGVKQKKKIKKGTVESKKRVSNRKREKKAADKKKGVKQQKHIQKKASRCPPELDHDVRVWVVASVLVAAVLAVGRRCCARCCRSCRGSSLLAAVCSGSRVAVVVVGCRGHTWVPRSRFVLELGGVVVCCRIDVFCCEFVVGLMCSCVRCVP